MTVDIACHFTSATSGQTFTVSSTDPLTVAASLNGTLLTLDPGHVQNTATVTVTRGIESYAIDVAVTVENQPPTVRSPLRDTTLASHGYMTSYSLSDHFRDPEGSQLTYSVTSSDPTTVGGSFYYSSLRVTTGEVTATTKDSLFVTATDPGGLSAKDTLVVTVTPNVGPSLDEPIPDTTLASHGYMAMITLSEHFSDPDGTPADLTYGDPTSTVPNVATATVSDGVLTVTSGRETGTAGMSVTATDTGGLEFSATFNVTVTRNQSPTVTRPIDDVELTLGGKEFETGLTGRFSDPEGGPLTFSVEAEDGAPWGRGTPAVTAEITDNRLTVTADFVGEAAVIVTATDPAGRRAIDSFGVRVVAGKRSNPDSVNVRNAPAPVGSISDQALTIVGSAVRIDVASFFMESDGDVVLYSARLVTQAEHIPDYVSVDMSGSMLTLTPGTTSGSIDVLVSASDIDGTASQTFTVNVANAN